MSGGMRQTPLTCSGHTRPVVDLAFSAITPCGFFLISACKDGKPMLRNGETGDWIGTFEGHKGAVWGCDLNADASMAATGSADFTAIIWDAVNGSIIHSFNHSHIVKSVNFSADGKYLLTSGNEKLLKIYDLNKLEQSPTVIAGHTSAVRQALFLNDDKWLVSVADDKTLRFWDRVTQRELRTIELPAAPRGIELSRDGNVVTVCCGNKVSFWDVGKVEKLKEFEIPTKVNSATLHPDKQVFVCGGEDFKMYKYNFESGTELESFKGHFGPVHCVRFSPDGELYASGSEDGTLRLWQTTVGKTYGLWKCVNPDSIENVDNSNVHLET
ncbi:serine-threonine kinase receptor-associated protein-like protein [Dinothrombium tinctorium]|uniref:Serine-threonine kinase receptor-associated protein n=1 Tax=Dinothrombium tinctorium TaxID=1965070 RepID=A0A443QA57_9ACAR|nr:serine-threonine kinase receptor-associated protein-like protein [Dinothrombium tinctorium]